MKVRLYAAAVPGRLKWRFTLNIDIDFAYWFEQTGGKASLHLLEPVLSLSEACELLAALERGSNPNLNQVLREWSAVCSEAGLLLGTPEVRTVTYADYVARRRAEPIDVQELLKMERLLAGRCFSKEELLRFLEHHGLERARKAWTGYLQAALLRGQVELHNGVESLRKRRYFWSKPERRYRCRRCGTGSERMYRTDCLYCTGECLYCEECITMGRIQSCSLLIYGTAQTGNGYVSARTASETAAIIGKWGLSPAQTEAARSGLSYLSQERAGEPGRLLIWAVTGAGKTEMIFPFIDRELLLGRRVLIATPRRDVVLELQPRLKRAFPGRTIVTLYGGSEERWEHGDITLSTTHQLLRFHRCFDLVIIDEIDAYPYHNNPMLQYAAERVCKRTGAYMLLSATPPAHLVRLAARNRLAHVKVPVRFHRHPLPIPQTLQMKELMKWKGSLPGNVKAAMQRSIDRGAQLFVFVPKIREVEKVVEAIRSHFTEYAVEGTSSQDSQRADRVVRFRQGDIRILVTTTILERGVTVPRTDVFILQADSATFDSAALIQMAGRAGRSKDDPNGKVFFAAAGRTDSQARAIRQIRQMNRLAKRKGYLLNRNNEEEEPTTASNDSTTKGGI
ncbi:DEAD/DEAH box helicase [Paenibacillus mesophilus]|uniref:DEAD/DEAH box helicase n=1 Tax=Paenibacillus mesophilus TaxID=2582849 RepID=UPI001EE469E5|nr:helicase-related protein [Paenibacillus mesophilus]